MLFATFEHVPAYPLVFPLFYGAAIVFALVMARHLRVFAVAGPSAPFGSVPRRLWGVIEYALIQTKMFKDPRAALMHWGIFWGFLLLTIGTANIVTGGLVQAVLSWPLDALLWTIVSALQNVVAMIVLVSIGYALFRRFVSRPARLTYSTDALIILGLIGGVVATEQLAPRGELPAMDLEREDATFGLRTLQDLGWKDLLDGFTCTECGRCQEACPAWATGKPLNPKTFIMGVRDMAHEAEAGVPLIPNGAAVRETYGLDDGIRPDLLAKPIVDTAIPYDAVWDCVTCGACVEACPVLIEHVDKIVSLRRNLVLEESRFPQELTAAMRGMEAAGNPWGLPRSTRTDWTRGLPFEVPTVAELATAGRLDEIEVLYWVGCAAAFDERNRKVARAFATCLDAAGVRFAILGQEESCTGDPARRMGNDYVYQILASGNVETLNRYGMGERTIVTACPHCFNVIGNEYGQLGGAFEIVHHSVYLDRLLSSGRLRLAADGVPARSVTYHDPCYLTRYNGIQAEPRDALASAPGVALAEMDRHGRNTFCCGAGGGRMWMEETRGTRINHERTREALSTGADTVAVACRYRMIMLKDGLADAGRGPGTDDPVSIADIAELLAESAVPAKRRLPVLQ